VVDLFFYALRDAGILDRRILTALYSVLFIAAPVYLLGQTIPLASHYFKRQALSEVTGKILFYSTLGSFLGATFSTLVLMAYVGVHITAIISLVLLTLLYFTFTKWKIGTHAVAAVLLLGIGAFINSGWMMNQRNIVSNNPYNTVITFEKNDKRFMLTNSSASSMYTKDGHKFPYIEAIEKIALGPIWNAKEPHDILVIGAGGFTLGHEDYSNNYDFVDIDKTLKEIAERDILKEKIPPNHKFHALDVRSFLNATDKKYDVIVLDAYSGKYTLPEHLLTVEFFGQIKTHMKDKGILAANLIFTPSFTSAFARNLDHTFRSVYPSAMTYVMNEKYDLWNEVADYESQVLYFYKNRENDGAPNIYSDMKNSAYADRPGKR
jgi:spermidine synthase